MARQMPFDASIIRDLEHVDWDSVYPRLLRYATYKCKKFEWLGTAAFDAQSMAQEAVALLFGRGKGGNYRNWNRKKCPDLIKFLEGVVDSLVSHEYEKLTSFKTESLDCEEQTDFDVLGDADPSMVNAFDSFSSMDPERALEMKENILRVVASIRSAAFGDETMEMVVACLEEGISKPSDIASKISIDVPKVYQILRRLREKISR